MNPITKRSVIAAVGDSITNGFPGNSINDTASWRIGFGPGLRARFVPTIKMEARSEQLWPVILPWTAVAGWGWKDVAPIFANFTYLLRPTHIIWQLGVNDAAAIANAQETVNQLETNIATCTGIAAANWPGIQQIFIGPWDHGSPVPDLQAEIATVYAKLAAAAAALTPLGHVVNWFTGVPMVRSGPSQNTVEGIHPNDIGGVQLGTGALNAMTIDTAA